MHFIDLHINLGSSLCLFQGLCLYDAIYSLEMTQCTFRLEMEIDALK